MRLEIDIRDQRTRKHLQCFTVEAEIEDVVLSLDKFRRSVLIDIVDRLISADSKRRMSEMTKNSDFFDSKGKDITHQDYFRNELAFIVRGEE